MRQETNGGSQTVDRALLVLDAVVQAREPVVLDRLTAITGLHRSIVYRLLRSLENAAYVARDEKQGGYTVGPALLAISVAVAGRYDIGGHVRPAMEQIAQEFGETVSLHAHSGNRRICVEVAEGTHPIRRMIPVGESHPVYVGETGRALLSRMPVADAEAYLAEAADAGEDPELIRSGMDQARQAGCFIGIGTRTPDVGAISIPIKGLDGTLFAMTISGPASRWDEARMHAAAPKIMALLHPVQAELAQGGQRMREPRQTYK